MPNAFSWGCKFAVEGCASTNYHVSFSMPHNTYANIAETVSISDMTSYIKIRPEGLNLREWVPKCSYHNWYENITGGSETVLQICQMTETYEYEHRSPPPGPFDVQPSDHLVDFKSLWLNDAVGRHGSAAALTRKWLDAWRHQAITRTIVKLSAMGLYGTHQFYWNGERY